jgi:hypothetical protein
MENTQQDQPFAVVAVLENVGCVQNAQHDLTKRFLLVENAANPRVDGDLIGFRDDFARDHAGKIGEVGLEEICETVEIGERGRRSFDLQD